MEKGVSVSASHTQGLLCFSVSCRGPLGAPEARGTQRGPPGPSLALTLKLSLWRKLGTCSRHPRARRQDFWDLGRNCGEAFVTTEPGVAVAPTGPGRWGGGALLTLTHLLGTLGTCTSSLRHGAAPTLVPGPADPPGLSPAQPLLPRCPRLWPLLSSGGFPPRPLSSLPWPFPSLPPDPSVPLFSPRPSISSPPLPSFPPVELGQPYPGRTMGRQRKRGTVIPHEQILSPRHKRRHKSGKRRKTKRKTMKADMEELKKEVVMVTAPSPPAAPRPQSPAP